MLPISMFRKFRSCLVVLIAIILLSVNETLQQVFLCGIPQISRTELIVPDRNTAAGAWPWHAAIYHRNQLSESYVCGGTLISTGFVLTAAYCVLDTEIEQQLETRRIFVRLGLHNLDLPNSKTVQQHNISRIHQPNSNGDYLRNNIAVLELATLAERDKYVQPACLGSSENLVNQYGTVIGWGATDNDEGSRILQSALMPVVDVVTCLISNRDWFGQFLDKRMFCAGYTNGTNICNGYSGGGLFFKVHNAWYLEGIVSFIRHRDETSNPCHTRDYVVFTEVSAYLPWISSVTEPKEVSLFDFLAGNTGALFYCRRYTMHHNDENPYACLCAEFGQVEVVLCRRKLYEELFKYRGRKPLPKLCMEDPMYYLTRDKCHEETVYESSEQPARKAMSFALNLFRAADPKNLDENFIISPLSLQVVLAQLIGGCSEEAKQEMIKGLLLNSHEVASLKKALQEAAYKDSSANTIDIASIFFKSVNLTLTQKFRRVAKMNWISMTDVDFSNTYEAARTVNEWAIMKTRGKIPQVVTEENLSPDMAILLLNAVYFKGTWKYKFNPSETNRRAVFNKEEGQKMPVYMMAQTNRLRFGEINYGEYSDSEDGLRWVELPYDGDQLSMIFFLPKASHQLDAMMNKLNGTHLEDIFKVLGRNHNPINIHLKVPRFTIKTSTSLVEPLKKLGIKKIFEEENPLSKLFGTPTRVGDVKQDAFLSIDEDSTNVTALSRVSRSLNSYEDQYFECNEPFMVMLVDKTRKVPLFMAVIRQPEKI